MPTYPVALPFQFSGAVTPGMLVSARSILLGYSFCETAGAVADWEILDGSANGVKVVRIHLNANESTREWMAPQGIAFEQGIYVNRRSGTVEGCIYCVPEERFDDYGYFYTESTG